jgi:UDP-N-acetylmuramoyl-tripeptide--D-alanyl-D-alanine ligase
MELIVEDMVKYLGGNLADYKPGLLKKSVSINIDSRSLTAGEIFWPIRGENFDGHDFIPQAIEKGVLMIVAEEKWLKDHSQEVKVWVPVKNTREALLKLAKEYSARFKIPKIGITGSNGKTTTKDMIYRVLSCRGRVMATQGNYNNQIGVPLTLFRLNSSYTHAVIEMGTSMPGEISILSTTAQPDTAVITNIGESHLLELKSKENIFREKSDITKGLRKGGTLFVNADDPFLCKMRTTRNYKISTYGIQRGQIKPTALTWDTNACPSFKIGRTKFELKVSGMHNLYNALAAIAVGVHYHIPKGEMAIALKSYSGSHLRMEIKHVGKMRIMADCYNANPASTRSALMTVGAMDTKGRRIAVLGDMLELGISEGALHAQIGAMVNEQGFDHLFTVGKLSEMTALSAIESGMNSDRVHHFADKPKLIKHLMKFVKEEDLLLVKASRGSRMEEIIEVLTTKASSKKS